MATFPICQLYIELENSEPKIWRRFEVSNNIPLSRLAYIILVLFEMRNTYSFQFKKDDLAVYQKRHPEYLRHPELLKDLNKKFYKNKYGITSKQNLYMYNDPYDGYRELKDVTKFQIKDIMSYVGDEVDFYYDPEVNWKFKIILEKSYKDILMFSSELPKVLDGSGYGIIETCSGIKGLAEFRKNLEKNKWHNKTGYQYYHTLDTKNDIFNFDKFNKNDMNFRIKKLPLSLQRRYEQPGAYKPYRIIKIMKRKYRVKK